MSRLIWKRARVRRILVCKVVIAVVAGEEEGGGDWQGGGCVNGFGDDNGMGC